MSNHMPLIAKQRLLVSEMAPDFPHQAAHQGKEMALIEPRYIRTGLQRRCQNAGPGSP
jgi:hypothetical protein